MKVREAANVGRVLIIVHLILSVCLSMVNMLQMLIGVGHGTPLRYLVTSFMYLVATVILDVSLLIVFGSLARTDEQFLRDKGEY